MSKGVLIYAHNNTEIDYLKIACANAKMIQYNLGVPVTLVTDNGTISWGMTALGKEFLSSCFEQIIEVHRDYSFSNLRHFSDTSFSRKSLQFYNCNHWDAYYLSPYDETLFIDADYLVMSNALSNCWGSLNDVMVSNKIYSPSDIVQPYHKSIDDMGIKLYWATVIYFKKSSLAEHLFSIMKHVQDNYSYYRDLYHFSNGMYRNDHAVSIAIHMMNGFSDANPVITELPIPGLLMSWDSADIQNINGINDITLFTEKEREKGQYILTRIKETDVHIMNKWAINRNADKLISLYGENCV